MSEVKQRLDAALAGRYTVERQVGEGGMATVFLARDLKHNRDVAVKVLRAELAATIGKDRFLREIEIAAQLQHPHILPVYDSGEADGILYYVMPFVEGESLRDRLEHGPMAAPEALRIAREVASALDYAHRQGVVHRDIKPANILLSQGHAVVADFGIARAATASEGQGLTQVGMAVGTPWYMSPEQATADPNVDGRTDIYALGSVLYELLEGKPPFDGATAQAVIAKAISAPVPVMSRPATTLPDSIWPAVQRALAKDPADRFGTAAEFADALDAGTGEFVAGARTRPLSKPLIAAVAAVVLIVVLVLLPLGESGSTVATGADVVAVLPFEVAGPSDELGEGMVSLLSTNLNALGAIRTVDARTVLQRWRSRGGEEGLDLEQSFEVGRDVDAGSVLMGSVVQAGSGVRLSAEMYTVEGDELARVQVDGDADDVLLLVDSLSLSIIRAIWRSSEPLPSFDVAAITSGSLEAVRAYMQGATFFRRGQWDSALSGYQEAIAVDSTFALAHLELSETYGWTGRHGSREQAEAVQAAARYADRLPPRERLLVSGYELNRAGNMAAVDTMLEYTRRYPTDPRGWYALGDFQHHGLRKSPLSPEDELAPFDRAIALDSSMAVALIHPMEIALRSGERERFQRYLELTTAAGADTRGLEDAYEAVWGNSDESGAIFEELLDNPYGSLQTAMAVAILYNQDAAEAGLAAMRDVVVRNPRATNSKYGLALIAMVTGRLGVLDFTLASMESPDPPDEAGIAAIVRILAVLAGLRPPEFAEPAVDFYRQDDDPNARLFIEAIIALAAGDPGPARALPAVPAGAPARLRYLRRGTLGWASLIEGDTTQAIELLRAATDSIGTGGLGAAQMGNTFRLQLARTLAMQAATRDEGIRRLRYGFNVQNAETYPASRIALAEALEAAGDDAGAALAYEEFLQLWSRADPELQPSVDAARQALERLTRERG